MNKEGPTVWANTVSHVYVQIFYVEHLAKASRRRSLRLVRTVPGHLMRTSRAKFEFSEAGICRALNEIKPEAQVEFICKAEENQSEL